MAWFLSDWKGSFAVAVVQGQCTRRLTHGRAIMRVRCCVGCHRGESRARARRSMARRVRGHADAQARQIFRDLIDMPADVAITENEIRVRFHVPTSRSFSPPALSTSPSPSRGGMARPPPGPIALAKLAVLG